MQFAVVFSTLIHYDVLLVSIISEIVAIAGAAFATITVHCRRSTDKDSRAPATILERAASSPRRCSISFPMHIFTSVVATHQSI